MTYPVLLDQEHESLKLLLPWKEGFNCGQFGSLVLPFSPS